LAHEHLRSRGYRCDLHTRHAPVNWLNFGL
jgi:hypothetical protein